MRIFDTPGGRPPVPSLSRESGTDCGRTDLSGANRSWTDHACQSPTFAQVPSPLSDGRSRLPASFSLMHFERKHLINNGTPLSLRRRRGKIITLPEPPKGRFPAHFPPKSRFSPNGLFNESPISNPASYEPLAIEVKFTPSGEFGPLIPRVHLGNAAFLKIAGKPDFPPGQTAHESEFPGANRETNGGDY